MKITLLFGFTLLLSMLIGFSTAEAQENIAQEAYLIFEQNCLNCHGEHGAFTENLVIEHTETLIESTAVVPGEPIDNLFFNIAYE